MLFQLDCNSMGYPIEETLIFVHCALFEVFINLLLSYQISNQILKSIYSILVFIVMRNTVLGGGHGPVSMVT